jgi:hypothetical protein
MIGVPDAATLVNPLNVALVVMFALASRKTTELAPEDAVTPVPPLATGRIPVTPVVRGNPVPFVNTIAEGVPKSPPLISSVPVASGRVTTGVPVVAADCNVCVPAPLALPWTLIFAI